MNEQSLTYLQEKVGETAAESIRIFMAERKCSFRVTRSRVTKRGDFRVKGTRMAISVNRDENKFRFIITLIHELAHLKTYLEFRNKVNPHGDEWKNNYRFLFRFFGLDWVFQENESTRLVYNSEISNPRACSGVDLTLERALSKFDGQEEGVFLDELEVGSDFIFRSQRYRKLENRRTRVLCINLSNGKKYTINKASRVFSIK